MFNVFSCNAIAKTLNVYLGNADSKTLNVFSGNVIARTQRIDNLCYPVPLEADTTVAARCPSGALWSGLPHIF
jgi:hypothetical protein